MQVLGTFIDSQVVTVFQSVDHILAKTTAMYNVAGVMSKFYRYEKCALPDCPSWLSSVSIIFQAHH